MKIINAIWEKRNLGTDVSEIICDGTEQRWELEEKLGQLATPYNVLKIPVNNASLLLSAQDMNYKLIEVSIELEGITSNLKLPELYGRFLPNLAIKKADKNEREFVLGEIQKGAIFETDRIAIDPFYSPEIAGKRYYNWIRDMIQSNADFSIGMYKESIVAFGVNKKIDEYKFDAVLGGVLPEFSKRGMGFLAPYVNLESIRKQGGKKIVTHVSSNNLSILKLHMQQGYIIKNMQYVLVRHNE